MNTTAPDPKKTHTPPHAEPEAESTPVYTPLHPEAPYPRELLRWRERFAVRVGVLINRPGILREISVWWGKRFTCYILRKISGHRWRHHNIEHIDAIETRRPLLVVSNHRTFFDMYVGITALRWFTQDRLGRYVAFPVRAPFFYERIIGVFVNLLFAGGVMWPPVFRGSKRGELNPVTVKLMQKLLKQERVCFGFHPEGRRSKSSDIYQLEPPKRGVGDLIQGADDELCILPLFISGLSGDMKREWRLRKQRDVSDIQIELYWGAPKRPSDYQGDSMEIARAVHADIQALGDQARAHETES